MAVRQRLVALMIVAMLAALILPSMALAVDPQFSPKTLVDENFNSAAGAGVRYQVTAHDPAAPSWWGISPAGGYLATGGMYVAGAPTLRAAYEEDSGGMVQLLPSESLANYYSSQLTFRMLQPSVGLYESASAPNEATGFSLKYKPFTEPFPQINLLRTVNTSWASKTIDLSNASYPSTSLSRADGEIWFNFFDGDEVSGTRLGVGPTIDDVKLTGWKYGKPRDVTAAITATQNSVRVGWTVPALHPGSTSPDTRGPSYRIWRTTTGAAPYTDVSGDADGTHATAILDPIVQENVTLSYVVQAWDPASGPGYGEPETKQVFIPKNPPTVAFVTPNAAYVASDGSLVIKATAADIGSGLDTVKFLVRRADGQYYNGTGWGAAKSEVDAEYDPMTEQWHYTLPTLKSDVAYTIVATAKDIAGLTGTATVVTTDSVTRAKPVLSFTKASQVLAYGGTGTVAGTLKPAPVGGVVVLQKSTDNVNYTDEATKSVTPVTGAFSFSVKPNVYTRYRIVYLGDVNNEPTNTASWISMSPKVKLTTTPWATYGSSTSSVTKFYKTRTYTWRTTIWPKHTGTLAGSYFQIYKRNSSGVYKSYKTVTAGMDTAHTSTASSRMKANYKITSAGKYRIRSYHNDDGHAGTYSSWKYFTVY